MDPTQTLRDEHVLIRAALRAFAALADKLEGGEQVPEKLAAGALDFFANFADAHHHAKEERILFPALENAGMPVQGGPLGVMLDEHEHGRMLLAKLRRALPALADSAGARSEFAAAARAYGQLLDDHIEKENEILFRMAARMLPAPDAHEVQDQFAQLEEDARVDGRQAAFRRALEELTGAFP
jgi:hemerythrin-like domain-containing protein